MKEQFTGGSLGKLKRLEQEGQTNLFEQSSENKITDFSKWTSQQRIELFADVRDKEVRGIPLNDVETRFVEWSKTSEEEKKEHWWN